MAIVALLPDVDARAKYFLECLLHGCDVRLVHLLMLPFQLIAFHGGLLEDEIVLADRSPIYLQLLLLLKVCGCLVVLMRILVVEMEVPVTVTRKREGFLELAFIVLLRVLEFLCLSLHFFKR